MSGRSRVLVLGFTTLLLSAPPSPAQAETYVSGPVSGTWTAAQSPYVATDTLEVLTGEELTILPGVEVLFDGPQAFLVHGTLRAAGVRGDSVVFAPLISGTPWRGLRFFDAGEGSYLNFCRLSESDVAGDTPESGCGGAVYSENSSPVIAHCTIESCRSESWGDPAEGGGAIYVVGGTPTIVANRIVDCYAHAFCLEGGGGICFRDTDISIVGNKILNCMAHGLGGGIDGARSLVEISHNVIAGCGGFHYAGGVALRDCEGRFFDNLVLDNSVEDTNGGGLYLRDSDVEVIACTIVSNSAASGEWGDGGGIWVSGNPQPTVRNSILWGNQAGGEGAQIWPAQLLYVSSCDVEGGYPGTGNFSADPLFVCGIGPCALDGFHLAAISTGQPEDSPCLDAGDRTALEERLHDRSTRIDLIPDAGIVDLGFHYPIVEMTAVSETVRADLALRSFPNPFRASTTIRFEVPGRTAVRLTVFDVAGRLIATLLDEDLSGGDHQSVWDGRDASGRRVSSGTYFYRLDAGPRGEKGKVVFVR